jgi:pilus assembly protein Flp/PilA
MGDENNSHSANICFAAHLKASLNKLRSDCFMKYLKAFIADESGATAIEYGLIAAGIALVIIAAVNGVGTRLSAKFNAISTSLK